MLTSSKSFYGVSSMGDVPSLGNVTQQHVANTRILVTQVAENLHLLKLRSLHCAQVPLSKDEEAAFLAESGIDALSRPGVVEELKLLDDTVSHPDPQKATAMLKEQIDSLFRFTFEEYSLRLGADRDAQASASISEHRLLKAVEFQRDALDTHRVHTKSQATKVKVLEQQVTDLRLVLAKHDALHKAQLTGYLKELCVLKEQLYRSYRDKDFVGKSIDLMECLVDDDTCEDVSVDELLMTRRLYRGVEVRVTKLKEKITHQEHDLKANTTFIERMKEKSRTQELTTRTLKADIEAMNAVVLKVEEERDLQLQELIAARETTTQLMAKLDIANRKLIRLGVSDDGSGGILLETSDGESFDSNSNDSFAFSPIKAATSTTTIEAIKSFSNKKSLEKVEMLDADVQTDEASMRQAEQKVGEGSDSLVANDADAATTTTTVEEKNAEANAEKIKEDSSVGLVPPDTSMLKGYLDDIERLTRELAEVRQEYRRLEKDYLDTKSKNKILEADAEELKVRCETAELDADNAMQGAAEHSEVLALEIQSAAQVITALRQRNKALMEGYLSMDQRLTALKSRAGIADYKKRANEFHLRRAAQSIVEAQKSADVVKAECRAEVVAAELKREHAEHQLAMSVEDMRSQEILQEQTIATLTTRTLKVQAAFEALLGDFENLRGEFMSQTTIMADNQAKIALKRHGKKADVVGGGASDRPTSHEGGGQRTPGGSRLITPPLKGRTGSSSSMKSGSHLATNSGGSTRQRFIFEMLDEQGMDTPTQVVTLCGHIASLFESNLKKGVVPVLKKLGVSGGAGSTPQDRMVMVSYELNNLMAVHFTELFNIFSRLLNLEKELRAREQKNKKKGNEDSNGASGGGGESSVGTGGKTAQQGPPGSSGPSRRSNSTAGGVGASTSSIEGADDASSIKREIEVSTDISFNSAKSIQEQKIVLAWEKMKTFTLFEKTLRHLVHDVRKLIEASEIANLYDDTQVGLPPREDDLPIQAGEEVPAPTLLPPTIASSSVTGGESTSHSQRQDSCFTNNSSPHGGGGGGGRNSVAFATGYHGTNRSSTPAVACAPGAASLQGGRHTDETKGSIRSAQTVSTSSSTAAGGEGGVNIMNDASSSSSPAPVKVSDGVATMTTSLTGQPASAGHSAATSDGDELSRALEGQPRKIVDVDDTNCGDFSLVSYHLKELQGRMQGGEGDLNPKKSSDAVPPWKRHKEAVRKKLQEEGETHLKTASTASAPENQNTGPLSRAAMRAKK